MNGCEVSRRQTDMMMMYVRRIYTLRDAVGGHLNRYLTRWGTDIYFLGHSPSHFGHRGFPPPLVHGNMAGKRCSIQSGGKMSAVSKLGGRSV